MVYANKPAPPCSTEFAQLTQAFPLTENFAICHGRANVLWAKAPIRRLRLRRGNAAEIQGRLVQGGEVGVLQWLRVQRQGNAPRWLLAIGVSLNRV